MTVPLATGLTLATALLMTAAAGALLRPLALRAGWVAPARAGRAGPGGVPLAGGLAVLFGLGCGQWLGATLLSEAPLPPAAAALVALLALLGLIDDLRGLSPGVRLAVEFLAAVVLLIVWSPAAGGAAGLSAALTGALWIVVAANAANLVDNADGLLAGVGLLTFLALAGGGGRSQGVPCLAAAGALGGFLVWNRPPARLYLGDHGSLALGGLLGWLLWRIPWGGAAPHGVAPLALLLCLGYFVFDPLYAVVGRLHRRRRPWIGGTDHPSHHLTRLWGSWPPALATILSVQAISVAAAWIHPWTHSFAVAGAVAGAAWVALLGAACWGARRGRSR